MRGLARALATALVTCWAAAAQAHGGHGAHCTPLGWDQILDPGPQTYEVRERIDLGGRMVLAIAFDELAGDYAKQFLFIRYAGSNCPDAAVSLGRYEATNRANAEMGLPEVFHLDLYEPGRHSTLGFFETAPDYDTVRKRALDVLSTPAVTTDR